MKAWACRWGAVAGVAGALCACQATPPSATPSPAASAAPVTADASYDWHSLVIVPFGMLLKDSPVALHEVLLFRDGSAAAGGEVESKDCYALEMQPPRFVGRRPDEYRLCFTHDHLRRIEASVDVPSAQAAALFAQVCAGWTKKSSPPRPASSAPAATAPASAPALPLPTPAGAPCAGREGRLAFTGLLGPASGDAAMRLSVALVDSPPEP